MKQRTKYLLLLALILNINLSSSNKISCPTLECSGSSPDEYHPATNICFEHDLKVPTEKLIGQDCQYHQDRTMEFSSRVICDFDLSHHEYAWVDELKQHLSGSKSYQPLQPSKRTGSTLDQDKSTIELSEEMSPMKNKRTNAMCRTYKALNNNKYAGRNCSSHDECYTMKCNEEGKCEGRLDTHTCHSHADCDAAFYCSKETKYPYISTCKTLKTSYAPCKETSECLHTLYCWYADIKETPVNGEKDNKQCLPMYSQEAGKSFGWYSKDFEEKLDPANPKQFTYEDYENNGRYCNTGLAFLLLGAKDENDGNRQRYKAICAAVDSITQGGKVLQSPYQCDPTDNKVPCVIRPKNVLQPEKGEVLTKEFSVPCKCALDGKSGYCSSILGTEEYKMSVASQYLQREKSRCHTMDRDNYISWLDCSTESNMDNIMGAINWSFNITHWPYIHNEKVKECLQTLSRKSWTNIQALKGKRLMASLAIAFGILVVAQ